MDREGSGHAAGQGGAAERQAWHVEKWAQQGRAAGKERGVSEE